MDFCENCNVAFEGERCPVCNTKKIRQVRDEDFCFLIEDSVHHSDVLMSVLVAHDIPHSAMPFGSGVESYIGTSLSYRRIYVPFGYLEKARDILREIEVSKTEELRALLLDNVSSFNILPKIEKKLRKKLKLPKETDLITFCVNIVKSASRIVDDATFGEVWRYVFCHSDEYIVSFNLRNYEILAVRTKK